VLVDGSAGPTLIQLSQNADLIAIGSRGRSGFKTTLFGSVALTVAGHADCPVAVTHPRLRTGGER
jgi:nucleotide-binding universal stress UspA family protein